MEKGSIAVDILVDLVLEEGSLYAVFGGSENYNPHQARFSRQTKGGKRLSRLKPGDSLQCFFSGAVPKQFYVIFGKGTTIPKPSGLDMDPKGVLHIDNVQVPFLFDPAADRFTIEIPTNSDPFKTATFRPGGSPAILRWFANNVEQLPDGRSQIKFLTKGTLPESVSMDIHPRGRRSPTNIPGPETLN